MSLSIEIGSHIIEQKLVIFSNNAHSMLILLLIYVKISKLIAIMDTFTRIHLGLVAECAISDKQGFF